jgi:hypothetical protein
VVNHALGAAVHAFSVRWLPLLVGERIREDLLNTLAWRLWHNARTKVLSVLQRRCFRSVLALYVFGMTPIPPGTQDSPDAQGSLGEVCIDTALRQLQYLTASMDLSCFSSASIAHQPATSKIAVHERPYRADDGYRLRETLSCWAGFVFDTSAALSTGRPSVLCAGVVAFEQDKTVQLLKSSIQQFHNNTDQWRLSGFDVTSQRAITIIQSASACKGLLWKAIASLREALAYNHDHSVVAKTCATILDIRQMFETTYAPLLAACKRALLFLDEEAQLQWCKSSGPLFLHEKHC